MKIMRVSLFSPRKLDLPHVPCCRLAALRRCRIRLGKRYKTTTPSNRRFAYRGGCIQVCTRMLPRRTAPDCLECVLPPSASPFSTSACPLGGAPHTGRWATSMTCSSTFELWLDDSFRVHPRLNLVLFVHMSSARDRAGSRIWVGLPRVLGISFPLAFHPKHGWWLPPDRFPMLPSGQIRLDMRARPDRRSMAECE